MKMIVLLILCLIINTCHSNLQKDGRRTTPIRTGESINKYCQTKPVQLITRDQALELAYKEASKAGFDVREMTSLMSREAASLDSLELIVSNNATRQDSGLTEIINRDLRRGFKISAEEGRQRLENKQLWFIYFYSQEYVLGLEVLVFLDATNGKCALIFGRK